MTRLLIVTCLVGALAFCVSVPAVSADEFLKSAKVDLDGDGKTDDITLTVGPETWKFVLEVNGETVSGKLGDPIDGFKIRDIDTSDKYKEIAVHTPGPSDDDAYLIFCYDGTVLREVGRLHRWPTFTGKGIVYVGDWMGFWGKTDRYILNPETHTLVLTPQELYYVGVKGPVRKTFPIYRNREDVIKKDGAVVANLREKSSPLIMLWDPSSNCYLLKSESGIVGWAANTALHRNLLLNYAD